MPVAVERVGAFVRVVLPIVIVVELMVEMILLAVIAFCRSGRRRRQRATIVSHQRLVRVAHAAVERRHDHALPVDAVLPRSIGADFLNVPLQPVARRVARRTAKLRVGAAADGPMAAVKPHRINARDIAGALFQHRTERRAASPADRHRVHDPEVHGVGAVVPSQGPSDAALRALGPFLQAQVHGRPPSTPVCLGSGDQGFGVRYRLGSRECVCPALSTTLRGGRGHGDDGVEGAPAERQHDVARGVGVEVDARVDGGGKGGGGAVEKEAEDDNDRYNIGNHHIPTVQSTVDSTVGI